MHYLWSVFSPVIFAAIGKQFLRVWGYIRSLQWLPSVKNRLRCPLCKQLCKQIGGYGVPRQIISQTRQAGVTDWYKQTDGGLRSLYRGPVCLLCATSVIATSILDRPEITDGFQICTRLHLLSRLQSDDVFALEPLLKHCIKRGRGGVWKPYSQKRTLMPRQNIKKIRIEKHKKREQKGKECEREGISCIWRAAAAYCHKPPVRCQRSK